MQTIPFQLNFRPAPPNVYGPLDYRHFRSMLLKIDAILAKTNLEHRLITEALFTQWEGGSERTQRTLYKRLKHGLRCNMARHLTGESYRAFSLRLADSGLFQWFTGTDELGRGGGISKSSLERYEKCFDEELVKSCTQTVLSELSYGARAREMGLSEGVNFQEAWMDSTCVKANIHFPVDWVLLRDATRSLLCAIKTIRKQGLKHRMPSPAALSKQMNKYCIEMSHTRRKKDSKKHRKFILRMMKKLCQCMAKHAKRYCRLLESSWRQTGWSEKQKDQVISRINSILEQLPEAIRQAHERLIGERLVKTNEKILSLYDKDVEVIVRGKAGNEVEFGQRLLLVEQVDGLLVEWSLFSKASPQDSDSVQPTVMHLQRQYGKLSSVAADRAFSSQQNSEFLRKIGIADAICPRSPTQLQAKLKDPNFVSLQTRRSQTEGRIGIFKNVFLGRPLRSRITENKRHAINWCILSHNLWVLARKIISDEKSELKQAA